MIRRTIQMSGRQVAITLLGGLGVLVAASVLAFVAALTGELRPEDGAAFLAVAALFPMAALLLWAYGWALATSEEPELLLGLARLQARWAAIAVGGGIVVAGSSWLIVTATSPWLGVPFNFFDELLGQVDEVTVPLVLVLLFLGVVLAPLWEEIVFRGALYGWLRRHLGVGASAVIVAFLHAFIHMDLAVIPALVVVFVVFALLYEWSGNLWVAILAHAVNNTLSFVWVFWQLG
jgi:hypothetical protein